MLGIAGLSSAGGAVDDDPLVEGELVDGELVDEPDEDVAGAFAAA